jgi:hypothetical protein
MKENNEQLKELLEKFYSEAEPENIARDIEAGEKLIRSYPVLEPAETTKWRIKAAVAKQLRAKKQQSLHRRILQAVAAVAVILVMLTMTARIIENGGTHIVPPTPETDIFAAMDAKTNVYSQEIDQIQRQYGSLQLGQTSDEELSSVDDLETEYIIIASDFWKGD